MSLYAEVQDYDRIMSTLLWMAEDDLASLLSRMSLSSASLPYLREEVRLAIQALVDVYGPAATEAALQWYSEVRPSTTGSYSPGHLAPEGTLERLDRTSRYAVGLPRHEMVTTLVGAMKGEILAGPRLSLVRAAEADPTHPRFARVPRGPKTCAFCSLMSSRGFVYRSRDLAGGGAHQYHDHCDCRIVPSWDKRPRLSGYDPDAIRAQYRLAYHAALDSDGDTSLSGILRHMRDQAPGAYTDGSQGLKAGSTILSSTLERLADSA